jgi:HSP20 family protein
MTHGMLDRVRGRVAPWTMPWDLQEEFNRMWNDFGGLTNWPQTPAYAPTMDVRETQEAFIVEADVPGMKKEDVQIEVADNVVTVKGERRSEREENQKDYHVSERTFGSFRRSVAIPGGFAGDKVAAKFENGVLTITLPKQEEKKSRKIEVRAE